MTAAASFGLPEIVAGTLLVGLDAYALTGGADFGGGVWDLLARGPRRDAQRALVADTIAPIWEANHVWLIVVVVVLFTGFPDAFATLGTVLHVPLTLLLLGIVLRGSAFAFRSYGSRADAAQRRWGLVFASSSIITPVLLGVVVGAIASGAVGDAAARLEMAGTSFRSVFVDPWLAPFPLAVGAMALALFAFLAAVYLTVAARDPELREDFRGRALLTAAAVFVTAFGALWLAGRDVPRMGHALTAGRGAIPLQAATAVAAITAIMALWTRHWRLARVAAAAQVSLIVWGWAVSQYPFLLPPALAIRDAAAPPVTLRLLLWGLAGGSAILLPSLVYLFRTFAAAREEQDGTTARP